MFVLLTSLISYLNRKGARIELRGERIVLITGDDAIRQSGSMSEVAFLKITLNERYNEVSYYSVVFKNGRRISFDYFTSGRDELVAILESQTGLRFTV
jgi:hypothetical protein